MVGLQAIRRQAWKAMLLWNHQIKNLHQYHVIADYAKTRLDCTIKSMKKYNPLIENYPDDYQQYDYMYAKQMSVELMFMTTGLQSIMMCKKIVNGKFKSLETFHPLSLQLHNVWALCIQIRSKLEQLERLRSEDTPRCLMITHTIESYWIPSQKKTKSKLQI